MRRILAIMLVVFLVTGFPAQALANTQEERIQILEENQKKVIDLLVQRGDELRLLRNEVNSLKKRLEAVEKELAAKEAALTPVEVLEKIRPSLITVITVLKDGGLARGTGVSAGGGQIITNRHVIEGAEAVYGILPDGRVDPLTIWSWDGDLDLAWLKLTTTKNVPPAAKFGDSAKLKPGEVVYAVGAPYGYRDTITTGIIGGLDRRVDHTGYGYIQTDAAVNPGNSGGPLLNAKMELVGLVTAKRTGSEGFGVAIPVNLIYLAAKLESRSYFGMTLEENMFVSEGIATDDLPLTVVSVDPTGPAAKAGIKVGDQILEVNDKRPTTLADVRTLIDTVKPGTTLELTMKRGAQAFSAKLTTSKREKWESVPSDGKQLDYYSSRF